MSSGPDLRVSHGLQLLATLEEATAAFAKKESQLVRDLSSRRFAANRRRQEALDGVETRLSARTAEVEATAQQEELRVRAIHESRRARIRRAHDAGIRNLPRRSREVKEGWMGELQMRRFHAQQKHAADLDAANTAFAAFNASLTQHGDAIARIRTRAQNFSRGYWSFRRLLRAKPRAAAAGDTPSSAGQEQLMTTLRDRLALARSRLLAFRKQPLPLFFFYLPLPAILLVIVLLCGLLPYLFHGGRNAFEMSAAAGCVLLAVACGMHRLGMQKAQPVMVTVGAALADASRLYELCLAASEAKRDEERRRIEEEYASTCESIERQWNRAGEVETVFETGSRERFDAQLPRAFARNEKLLRPRLSRIESIRAAAVESLQAEGEDIRRRASDARDSEMAALDAEETARWEALETAWKHEIVPIYWEARAMGIDSAALFPAWDEAFVENWQPPAAFATAARFAQLHVDLAKQSACLPKDPRLALPGPARISLPLAITFPQQGSLLFETSGAGGPEVFGALNNVILRLLTSTPPGKLSFTIIDPVGLGQNFAGFMHLSDYEESLINRRIWTQRDQIEERLAELSEHIEKVIQMYLRNEYATITEYNEQAGSVAEKYHFLVVADFPSNFSDIAAKRLQSIAVSGPRCGIYTLIHWDRRLPLPDGFNPEELRKNSVCIQREGGAFLLDKRQAGAGATLVFDPPAEPELAARLIHKIGKRSIDSNRVEVPFEQIAPEPSELWTNDTTGELRIAIGRTGATKHQMLAIGKGTRQHALFAGKTGSGKSTLFHVIITNLALACSPEQVEFYLVDFKKGVEFKCYAAKRLPHARVIAIESDREFGLSVLQRVDDELKRRGDMFRKLGVQDLAGYKKAGGGPLPRSLLIIDEFQEFFIEDDAVSQAASMLFDRIVRQGRAFGIHVLLGSQTLGGAYSLARATLGQMVIRVALQCNEADAYLIMDDSNPAPRLLTRPGEGIYNDAAGAIEGNSPFQVVWLPDEERDAWLDKVRDLAAQRREINTPAPIVFEGNAPADVRDNALLATALAAHPAAPPHTARAWLGAPNAIKGPTEAAFQRQSGNNLLLVGQRDETCLTLLGLSALSLAAQYPPGAARFILLQAVNPGSAEAEFIRQLSEALPGKLTVARTHEIPDVLNGLAAELKARSAGDDQAGAAPAIFFLVHGLHKFKKLRHEDDFSFSVDADAGPNAGAQFTELLTEGSTHGIHILASIDTLNNINRFMNRKALSEFGMRVLFQMSANDSAGLIDTPKASDLGLHRAIFYNEHEGQLETFRPYAVPAQDWMRDAGMKIAHTHCSEPAL